ncbi:hypothetical protein TspCOW1_05300 [Thiohalobacter sp. COW1]|uniref:hypothetical protein n=1 Tax=Thiohalobacter sp. COW1 TaxID=2795687 RepID=UPI001915B56B|nr:hypothetical protein [Thiohalobacter sp. COW1]BCO30427.1 hypothetical protein TspCOW1_05300 [Thiohalobacter sp. COW1]
MKNLIKYTLLACVVMSPKIVMAEGYTSAPGRYQPKNKIEAEQERAMDEWVNEEKAKLQGSADNAASRTGYKAAPGRYQPENRLEAEHERAMDEWMNEQRN